MGLNIKNLFKRKAGGTMMGNLLRTTASIATKGVLGQGAMMLQPGETPAQANERTLVALDNGVQNAGAGVIIGNKMAWFTPKNILLFICSPIAFVIVMIIVLKKKGSTSKK